jgi:hypothetical protein
MLVKRFADFTVGCLLFTALLQASSPTAATQVDTQVVELNRFGFTPKQINRTVGAHYIYVRNVSGLRNLTLKLLDQSKTATKQQNLTATSPHWRELVNLPPGTYTLTEPNHPTWTCTITINSK